MTFRRTTRLFAIAAMAALAMACKEPPAPTIVAAPPPPPPPPAPPSVSVSTEVVELASTYRAVMTAAAGIQPNFASGSDVAEALKVASAYEGVQLQQGAVAFMAVAALQQPEFVANARAMVDITNPSERRKLADTLASNPTYVTTIPGVEKAAGLAIAAVDGLGARVTVAGRAVKQSAYDIQRQRWSLAKVDMPDVRLSDTKLRSAERRAAALEDVLELRQASLGQAAMSLAGEPVPHPYSPTVTRGLALAAISAIGEGGDENASRVQPLLKDEQSGYCLNMAKLNLFQCLAVAGPHYEDVFCLGQHAMIDTGKCMIAAANSPTPAFVEPPPPPPPPPPAPKARTASRRR